MSHQSSGGTVVMHLNHCSSYLYLKKRQLHEFKCTLYELFTKIWFLELEKHLISHFHKTNWKTKFCDGWEYPISDHKIIKLLEYCVCFTLLCINLLVLSFSPHEYDHKILWEDRLPKWSFQCKFLFQLYCTQLKTDLVHVEGSVPRVQTAPDHLQKLKVWR